MNDEPKEIEIQRAIKEMTEEINQNYPKTYQQINSATKASGFDMASDVLTCSLLKTLAATKPSGKFLELGTGTGLSTSWILDGLDEHSTLTSIDNDAKFLAIAKDFLSGDERLTLVETDGAEWSGLKRIKTKNSITYLLIPGMENICF